MGIHVPDRFDLIEEAKRATAPSVREELLVRTINGDWLSATGIPTPLLRIMWWRKSVVREGESYEVFHARAVAQRRAA